MLLRRIRKRPEPGENAAVSSVAIHTSIAIIHQLLQPTPLGLIDSSETPHG